MIRCWLPGLSPRAMRRRRSSRGTTSPGAWARERQSNGQSEVVHCHLLFHLPVEYRSGKRLPEVEAAILRLTERHGRGIFYEGVIKLVIHHNPDGKYLIKGGGPKVWQKFGLRKEHRRLQGFIHGKRCGVTENISPAARKRLRGGEGSNDADVKAAGVKPSR